MEYLMWYVYSSCISVYISHGILLTLNLSEYFLALMS